MSNLLYPRLADSTAMDIRQTLLASTFEETAASYALAHPGAYFAAVGGTRVTPDRLERVRHEVLSALEPQLRLARTQASNRSSRAEMDAPLGEALRRTMGIVPSDAAHDGVWSFLSLVLLPEVTRARFPDGHVSRWLGRPRNALRRTWWRQHVLGEEFRPPEGIRPLGEDELVGLFERSTIGSDRRLVRALARRILAHRGADRSEFARRLSKRVLAEMAFTEIALLSDDELEELIDEAIRLRGPSLSPPSSSSAREPPAGAPNLGPVLEPVTTRLARHLPWRRGAPAPARDSERSAREGADSSDHSESRTRISPEDLGQAVVDALREMGGSGRTGEVLDRVGYNLREDLTFEDLEVTVSGLPRWRGSAQAQRSRLISAGVLRGDSPSGVWQLTDEYAE